MLYPDYFQTLPTEVFDLYQTIEDDIISDIARRIKKAGTITASAEWQTQALLRQGNGYREIKKEIRKKTEIANKELTKLINQTAIKAYAEDMKKYKIGGIHLPAYKSNSAVLQIVEAVKKNGLRDMKNISNTLGVPFQGQDIPLNEFYQRTLGRAVLQVTSGAFSLDEVLKRTIQEIGDRGIRSVDWESGYSTTIETAARRSVMTTLAQLSSNISNQNLKDTGAEYIEVSAHSGARPDHADWQGQVYHVGGEKNGYKDFASSTDYGSERGLCGYNCRHSFFPFFPGTSERSYTDSDLENIDPPPRLYEGKEYSHYEATQKQRQIENSIRKSKRMLVGYDAAEDKNSFILESVKLRRKSERYHEFSDAMNLSKKGNRSMTYAYGKGISTRATGAYRKVSNDKILMDIYNKSWSDAFIKKAAKTYRDFKAQGCAMDSHFIGRFLQRQSQRGFSEIFFEDVLKTINNGYNYTNEEGNLVFFNQDLNFALIQNAENKEYITLVRRKKEKGDWIKI